MLAHEQHNDTVHALNRTRERVPQQHTDRGVADLLVRRRQMAAKASSRPTDARTPTAMPAPAPIDSPPWP